VFNDPTGMLNMVEEFLDDLVNPSNQIARAAMDNMARRGEGVATGIKASVAVSGYFGNPIGLALLVADPKEAASDIVETTKGALTAPINIVKSTGEGAGTLVYAAVNPTEEGIDKKVGDAAVDVVLGVADIVSSGKGAVDAIESVKPTPKAAPAAKLSTESKAVAPRPALRTAVDEAYGVKPKTNSASSDGVAAQYSNTNPTKYVDPHGNSLNNTKPHHVYEIIDNVTGRRVKTGVSGQPLNQDGSSPRANRQVNALNKKYSAPKRFSATVIAKELPNRRAALATEQHEVNTHTNEVGKAPPGNILPKPNKRLGPLAR